ncbi:hypothetical protein FRC10_001162 [Ceratobasidium sp. 414]|nr:hypothetical protein FRC10_001162 [Ceratobasidium sp. 414]
MGMAFVPPKKLKKIFPPIVTGTVILLIGASLIGESDVLNWGGGSNDCHGRPTTGIFTLCPTIFAKRPLPWGSPEFIGLGFLSFITIVLVELFGSPFLKNASIIVGLLVGCIVAGAAGYMDSSQIESSPAITFLWVHTFKIRVYPPAILPMLAVYVSLAMEAIGDITASAEVSRVEVDGEMFDSRIQGGVLADGLGGFISALFTVTPLSIFAQNNGVIAITRCANRGAGRWCCAFLIFFGILGKISGVFLSTLSFGLGNLLVPTWYTHLFNGVEANSGLQGFFDSITIVLTTPFLIAGIVAVIKLAKNSPIHSISTYHLMRLLNFPIAYRQLELPTSHRAAVVNALVHVHLSLHEVNQRLSRRQGRYNHVTPRHYLDLLNRYVRLYNEKRDELEEQQWHLHVGLDKLRDTVTQVEDIRKSLAIKSAQLETKNSEANEKLQRMVTDQQEAEAKN